MRKRERERGKDEDKMEMGGRKRAGGWVKGSSSLWRMIRTLSPNERKLRELTTKREITQSPPKG